ncbi:sensor histidine kinase [Herbiconiux sp. A18JL235]|uniref:histidine kinase n=1 Tax=Herbiconiux sp. A18JL235 TaxID=3152363 RepID=A0AB39BKR1_9MICO
MPSTLKALLSLRRLRPLLEPSIAVVYALLWVNAEIGRSPEPGFYLALGAYAVAIAVSRRLTTVSIVIVVLVPLLQLVGLLTAPTSTAWPLYQAVIVVAFAAGCSPDPRIRWSGLAGGLVQALVAAVVLVFDGDWLSWTGGTSVFEGGALTRIENPRAIWVFVLFVLAALVFLTAWGAGVFLHISRRRRAEQNLLAETEAELAVADVELRSVKERDEIAQEVHDVLAHSLAVVIAVADGTRFLRAAGLVESAPPVGRVGDGDGRGGDGDGRGGDGDVTSAMARERSTDDALGEIAAAARTALLDLRGLLEGLHDQTRRPQPRLVDLGALVDRMSSTGMEVRFEQFGEPRRLTPSQEAAVYRIVQESLTNALKHGGESPCAAVSLAWGDDGLVVGVVSGSLSGGGAPARPEPALGVAGAGAGAGAGAEPVRSFGITGMRDRARLAGGWLTASAEGEEFVVTAFIPVHLASARATPSRELVETGERP